jgi:hypothetical protein
MTAIPTTPLLRYALIGDAVASAATGLLLAAGASPLEELLGYPTPFLRWVGIVCILYAAVVALLGMRASLPRAVVLTIVILNAMWVVESLILLMGRMFAPTGLGVAFVLLQAAVVAAFAVAQWMGLKAGSAAAGPAKAAHA